jgi:hypothetical protein
MFFAAIASFRSTSLVSDYCHNLHLPSPVEVMASESPIGMGTNESRDYGALIYNDLENTINDVLNECYDVPTNNQIPCNFVAKRKDGEDEILAWVCNTTLKAWKPLETHNLVEFWQ